MLYKKPGIYYKPTAPDRARQLLDEELMARIDYWHTKCPYFGSRKILDKPRKEGYAIGRKDTQVYVRDGDYGYI